MIRAAIVSLSLALALGGPAAASGLTANQTVQKVVVTTDEAGNEVVEYVEADLVAPGDTVVYTLTYANDGEEPAEDVVLTMPVPAEMSFVEGSAKTEMAMVGFSIDGGATFVPRGELAVTLDGEAREALSDEITHVRWSFTEAIPVGEDGIVSYHAILN